MLNGEVKKRINTCRDILVGKLPDPKSQVLQITNALIYKFMDDQDRMAEKLGGKASFFVNKTKPYAWHKLFDSKLTNQQRADLYIEGIQKLSEAKHLPELFQEIFKEAYVPFRSAATITLFLDEINKFDYTHSEELGNAYEYLLNIMGTQADAGQFRTPRHIIEFIVDIVDPKKNETIYDPAAGTAGFLIAAYNHVVEANQKLTASEKRAIGKNISGIDISPDMAKMARVNLYLHGFTTPNILEGDTLSDENLWGKKHDVILANPPFMSPKGGIIPHDKFGVKAKRSEVLFVDYIAEHLKLKGRAGIIVPEGVIFQSGTAYKELRKMLVEDGYLYAVLSLPAGVFQPYSGVKTSVLILDREKAKEAEDVLFIKIENDGYTSNTQRTTREGSQLPEALAITRAWREGKKQESRLASWVSKKEIAESGDFNLSGEHYRTFEKQTSLWPVVELKEICEISSGNSAPQDHKQFEKGEFPFYRTSDVGIVHLSSCLREVKDYLNKEGTKGLKLFKKGTILFPKSGASTFLNHRAIMGLDGYVSSHLATIVPKENKANGKYVYYLLTTIDAKTLTPDQAYPSLKTTKIGQIKIPLPPLDVQKEIVAELDRYQKIIDGALQVVQNYKPSFKIDPEWKTESLGELFALSKSQINPVEQTGEVNYIGLENIESDTGMLVGGVVCKYSKIQSTKNVFTEGDILYGKLRPNLNKVWLANIDGICSTDILVLKPTPAVIPEVYEAILRSDAFNERVLTGLRGAQMPRTNYSHLASLSLPVIPMETQKKIKEQLSSERNMLDSTKKLVVTFEQKIQEKIVEVWGK